jgi:hypothetical protein
MSSGKAFRLATRVVGAPKRALNVSIFSFFNSISRRIRLLQAKDAVKEATATYEVSLPVQQPVNAAVTEGSPIPRAPMTQGDSTMRFSSGFRAALVALFALAGAGVSSAAHADSGTIWISELKGGWFIGASGGSGTLIFHGRRYPLSIGGLSVGLVFGASETRLYGHVSNIRRPSDVAGVYGAAGAGAALVVGARAIVLRNEKGAVLTLSGRQVGLIANADLSGLAISLR